jgi:hypothetical protein
MKLIYLTVDGRARIENTKINTRLIEETDGYHPVTNDSVWQDSRRIREPIMFITQGVLGPYGATMTKEDTLNVLFEIEAAERAFKPQSVSKMWMRNLAAIWEWLAKYGIYIFIAAAAGYALVSSILGGHV